MTHETHPIGTGEGRPVSVHASGGGAVTYCIMCGVPYRWHDRNPDNWLVCPSWERLVEIEADLEQQLIMLTEALSTLRKDEDERA